jgi:hypothetical protein
MEAVKRWHELHDEQERKRERWREQRRTFLQGLPDVSKTVQVKLDRSAEGLVYFEQTVKRWRNGKQVEEIIGGWGLPYLAGSGPPVDFPLPPPTQRALSADECYAALLAIHDEISPEHERMGPTDSLAFARLQVKVLPSPAPREQGLVENQLPALRAMLKIVATSATSRPKHDGLVGVAGFSYRGVEVQFGRAEKQLKLVLALWDTSADRPRDPLPIEDVINAVWGEENEVEDSTFRQLYSDVNTLRFQANNCPIRIESRQGKVRLVPLST